MNNDPVLDRNHLHEMTDGDAAFQRELLLTYLASAEVILTRLKASLSADDLRQITREAHALKGSSLNVGAVALGHCAAAIEAAARAGDLTQVSRAAARLDAEQAALWAELDRV